MKILTIIAVFLYCSWNQWYPELSLKKCCGFLVLQSDLYRDTVPAVFLLKSYRFCLGTKVCQADLIIGFDLLKTLLFQEQFIFFFTFFFSFLHKDFHFAQLLANISIGKRCADHNIFLTAMMACFASNTQFSLCCLYKTSCFSYKFRFC